jgi:hypothetical protein
MEDDSLICYKCKKPIRRDNGFYTKPEGPICRPCNFEQIEKVVQIIKLSYKTQTKNANDNIET